MLLILINAIRPGFFKLHFADFLFNNFSIVFSAS